MAAPITLGGLASGMDTTGLISQLVGIAAEPMRKLQTRAKQLRDASGYLSDTSRLLSSFSSATQALDAGTEVASFKATSSNSDISVSAGSSSQPGTFSMNVTQLAQEQRTYSQQFSSKTTALAQTGSLKIKIGTTEKEISVTSTDTLEGIASKINSAGGRFQASVFQEGTKYRLQIRGMDSGAANALTFTETGTDFDLNGAGADPQTKGKTVQVAQDAKATVDTFEVTSSTNTFTNAIAGLTVTAGKAGTTNISVASDADTLLGKLRTFVGAYNGLVGNIHINSGYGSTAARSPMLRGDSALRDTNRTLASVLQQTFTNSGPYQRLGDVGITLNRDGALQLDEAKLRTAFDKDVAGVQKLFAGEGAGKGAMGTLRDALTALSSTTTGKITVRQKSFNDQATRLDKQVTQEELRLERYEEQLKRQFAAMETAYSKNQYLLGQVSRLDTTG